MPSMWGNFYGTSMAVIREKLDQGIDVILEIEIQGRPRFGRKCRRRSPVFGPALL